MGFLRKIKNRTKWLLSYPKSWINNIRYRKPTIKSVEETILKIEKEKCSIARYGDGEFNIMFGNNIDFQRYDKHLAQKMKDILKSEHRDFLVGLPGELYYYKSQGLKKETERYWKRFRRYHHGAIGKLLRKNKIYYHASMTRFYYCYTDQTKGEKYARLLKQIWDKRKVLFVEGEKSRLGVGNDFFDNAERVTRILCPTNNAFNYYDEIIATIEKNVDKDTLVLLALGPTATALAYDLYLKGYQAVDIGHVDIEYEWMRMGATSKVAVKGKYTNEAEDGKIVEDMEDVTYKKQIIARIGID